MTTAASTATAATTSQSATAATTPAASTSVPGPATLALTHTQLQALIDGAVARAVAATTPASSAPAPANPPSKVSLFAKGALVCHRFYDTYDERTVTRYGVVVEAIAPQSDTGYASSRVGWFTTVSGPIGDHELEEA